MEEKRCYGCMKIKSGESVCEHCGYDENTQNETHQLTAGTILKEQYLIGKVLGQGGFGITYLGWDMYLDIPVAIKEYFPNQTVMRDVAVSTDVVSYSGDAGVRFRNNKERFMREAKMLARFSQVPEIVQVRNFFLANNTAYIVMEYVEGITLKQLVKEHGGVLPKEMTFEIIKPIIEALCKVHKAGLVHRDISPDNIMMLPNGRAKLLDFGAVRDVGGADVNSPLSQSTEAILKQGYAPIEQYQNRGSLGPWTDVYALCATIYYCLTGNVPTDAPGRLLEDEEISFEGLGLLATELGALQKGMALRANDRIQSMDDLLKLLSKEDEIIDDDDDDSDDHDDDEHNIVTEDEKRRNLINLLSAGLIIAAVTLCLAIGMDFAKKSESEDSNPVSEEQTVEELSEDNPYQGQCGENIFYSFDEKSQVLNITGSGEMYDFNGTWQLEHQTTDPLHPERTYAPWSEYKEDILSVYIGDGITKIGENAFENCHNLGDVRFGNDIKSIGFQAFLSTAITEAVLPEGLEGISGCAFNYCEALEKVVLPESLKTVEGWAFNECPMLGAVVIGDETEVQADAFHCEIDDAEGHKEENCLNDMVLYVTPGSRAEETALNAGYSCKEKAFGWCGATVAWYIDLDEKCLYLLGWGGTGVYQIGEDTPIEDWMHIMPEEWISRGFPEWVSLYSNKIEKIQVGPYIGELNHRVFNALIYLKEVDLGSVQSVCAILDGCSVLEEVIVPETVQVIEWDSFAYCENLRKVTILGENVRIDRGVFRNTPNLEEVYFSKGAVIDDTYGDLFDLNLGGKVSPKVTFYVYEGSDAQRYAKKYEIPYEIREEETTASEDGTTFMGQCGDDIRWTLNTENHTLYLEGTGQTWLYRVQDEHRASWEESYPAEWIHSGEPEWAEHANGIYHIVIGDGITHLNHAVFQNLPHLKDVDFGNTVEFTESAFQWNMYSLEEITFPESVKVVGGYTLLWNSSLRKVVFERDDVEIHWGALAACNRLEEVYFPRNAVIVDDIIDPDGNDPYSKNLTFYVYEGTDAHEKAKWYAEKYGVNIAFRED